MVGGIFAHVISLLLFLTNFEYFKFPFMIPYFMATFFFGFGNIWYVRSSMVVFRRQLLTADSAATDLDTKWWWTLLSTNTLFLARFFGSLISGSVIFLSNSKTEDNLLACSIHNPYEINETDMWSGCCFSYVRFYQSNCHIQHFRIFFVILLAVVCCCGLILMCSFNYICLYEEDDESITQ